MSGNDMELFTSPHRRDGPASPGSRRQWPRLRGRRNWTWSLAWLAAALVSYLLLGIGQDVSRQLTGPLASSDGSLAAPYLTGFLGVLRVALPVFFLIVAVFNLFRDGAGRSRGRPIPLVAATPANDPPFADGAPVEVDLLGVNYGLLRRMEWRRFEIVCAEYLRCLGYEVMERGYGRRQGFDLEVGLPGERQPSHLVKCYGRSRPAGVAPLKDFHTAMRERRVAEGMAFSICGFTRRAERFAAAHRIALLSGEAMCAQIARFDDETRSAMIKVATSGNYTTPMCPACGIRLVLRRKRRTGAGRGEFWGCVNYPRCRVKLPLA